MRGSLLIVAVLCSIGCENEASKHCTRDLHSYAMKAPPANGVSAARAAGCTACCGDKGKVGFLKVSDHADDRCECR